MFSSISPAPRSDQFTTPMSAFSIHCRMSAITTVGTMYGKSSSPRNTEMPRQRQVQEQRERDADHGLQHDRGEGPHRRLPERLPEERVRGDRAEVVQPGEARASGLSGLW